MALGGVVPALPEVFVFPMKKRGNQIILGSKMAIEAGFGNASFFDDQVHTHSMHSSAVEEGGCSFEDAVSHIHCALGRIGHVDHGAFSHARTFRSVCLLTGYRPVRIVQETDRSVS